MPIQTIRIASTRRNLASAFTYFTYLVMQPIGYAQ